MHGPLPTQQIKHGDYREVLTGTAYDLIFTSPPYNIGSKGKRKDGCRKLGKFDPKSFGAIQGYSDKLSEDMYQQQQIEFLIWCADHLKSNGTLVYNHKPIRHNKRLRHPAEWFLQVQDRLVLMEEIIWDRGSTHNHDKTMMWPHTESLYVFRRTDGTYRLQNTNQLPHRSNVWRINRAQNIGHCAPFPIELAEAVIQAWSCPNDMVCDPYSGSGTTALAAKQLNRSFEGAELLRKYYKLALERIGHA
jgi:site-specific DNA-methyltransferase (adenine-specific)